MSEKVKMGRPPRAKGEKMQRLSVVVRQRYREALDLIARNQHTSASQALELVMTAYARQYEIDGVSVLAIADQLAALDDSEVDGLKRLELLPVSLRTPGEDFAIEVLEAIGGYADMREDEAIIFGEVIRDVLSTGGDAAFAAQVWKDACAAWKDGHKSFAATDNDGFVYTFDFNSKKMMPFSVVPYLERAMEIVTGVPDATAGGSTPKHKNPTPRGPAPKGRKKPSPK